MKMFPLLFIAQAAAAAELMFHGCGNSMQPVFPCEATYLVNVDASFGEIHLGQVVQYRRHDGTQTAHLVVERILLDRGLVAWRVKGLTNAWCDPDLVTPANFIGIVNVPSVRPCHHLAYNLPNPVHEYNAMVRRDPPRVLVADTRDSSR